MKNNLTDLNNYLFECIERLTDDDLSEDQLNKEIIRAEAVKNIASTIIDNGRLALQVKKHLDEFGAGDNVKLPLLEAVNE